MKKEEGTMNKRSGFLMLLTVICFLLTAICSLLTGCNNILQQPNDAVPVEAGYGRVDINFTGGEERTVLPAKVFDNYVYTFTKAGESFELPPDTDGLFTLEVGAWQIYVEAYIGEVVPANLAASGTGNFTVNAGITIAVTVVLDAVETDGYGTFTYAIRYPAGADIEITLQKLPGLTATVNITPGSEETNDGTTEITKTAENVPAGFYLLTVQIRNGGWHTGISEAVHIYPLITTGYTKEFELEDMLPTLVNIAAIKGIIPVTGEAPATEITATEQYSGTVTWSPSPAAFAANTTYTAAITLTAKDGYTLQSIPANFFTVATAVSVSNAEDSELVTAVFYTPDFYLRVTNTTEWEDALTLIRSGGNDKSYIIDIDEDAAVNGITNGNNGFGTVTGITVTLTGNGKLYLMDQGSIIRVGDNQTLIIDSGYLVLEGLTDGQNGAAQDNDNTVIYVDGTGAWLELKNGIISGNTATRGGGVYVNSGTFTMSGGEISGNTASSYGGGVFADSGTFTMSGGEISGNTSSYGGGVFADSGTFTMSGGEISGNTSSYGGGGVYVGDGDFTMEGGEISGNTVITSSSYGGGVYVSGGTFTMNDGEVSGNTTSYNGGGVYVDSGTFTMNDGEISGNTASFRGGGVYVSGGTFTMSGGEISDNTASSHGGGVSVSGSGSTFTMNGGEISGNSSSSSYGGGVYMDGGTSIMEGGKISGNTASFDGGGVYVYSGTFTMNDGEISGNTSSYGGGMYVNSGTFTMNDGEISGNTAYSSSSYAHGGGVYVGGGIFTMNDGEISGNTATGSSSYGGGVFAAGTFTMESGEISGNTASSYGGGVYMSGGIFTMSGGEISNNTATISGGGVSVGGNVTFTMSGGEISGNTASSGGGVYVNATFTMNDGEISGNTATASGGGVSVGRGTFTKTGGTITGYLSGTVNGNVVKDTSGTVQSGRGHAVYVYASANSVEKRRETTAGPDANLSYNGSTGVFGGEWYDYTVTFDVNGGTGTVPDAQTANAGSGITLPGGDGLTMGGYVFSGWNTDANGTGGNYSARASYTVTGNITLYARWNEPYDIPEGGTIIRISTQADFESIRSHIDDPAYNYGKNSYVLEQDITLSGTWTPIGRVETVNSWGVQTGGIHAFSGNFYGNGHTIRNLVLPGGSINHIGLFGHINGALIQDLQVELGTNVITLSNYNGQRIGIIAGTYINSVIKNCGVYSQSEITISGNSRCIYFGGISVDSEHNTSSNIENCYVSMNITISNSGTHVNASALLLGSDANTIVRNCYYLGTITSTATYSHLDGLGGSTTIRTSYNAGKVINNAPNTSWTSAKGLGGDSSNSVSLMEQIHSAAGAGIPKRISDSTSANLTNNYAYAGMLLNNSTVTSSDANSQNGLDKTAAQLKQQATYESGLGWDFADVWEMGPAEYPFPILKWQNGVVKLPPGFNVIGG